IIAILMAILFPTIARHISDSRVTRAANEAQVITAAVSMLFKDTGKWPSTNNTVNRAGPSGRVDRVLSGMVSDPVPTGVAPGARAGAANWGVFGSTKQLADYLFYNNPDEDSGVKDQNQPGQDYKISGEFAWRGPYVDKEAFLDPWGRQYVISARYFPGVPVAVGHSVLLLSAGKDGLWSTAYSDAVTRLTEPKDTPYGSHEDSGTYIHDDVGLIITINK
ncbi:MAG: hypothetical protein GY940_43835, partial [bacterium]|nr:hypothetical protein [bacterium]